MIISTASRKVSVLEDEGTAAFVPTSFLRNQIGVASSSDDLRTARACVEILQQLGGLMPRALIGGVFVPSSHPRLDIEVRIGVVEDSEPSCVSQLADPLRAGLPEEYAESVLSGVSRELRIGGTVVIDRAAFDLVESSTLAFTRAAVLLGAVLTTLAAGDDIERAVNSCLATWD